MFGSLETGENNNWYYCTRVVPGTMAIGSTVVDPRPSGCVKRIKTRTVITLLPYYSNVQNYHYGVGSFFEVMCLAGLSSILT